MRELMSLQAALARSTNQALERAAEPPPSRMAEVAEKITCLFPRRGAATAVLSFGERELKALRAFRDRIRQPDLRTVRLACSACAHYIEDEAYVLLADAGGLSALLSEVERYADTPRLFRRLYDVLRRAYLGAEREEHWFKSTDARRGNERLRRFLEAKLALVRELEPVLDWVRALASYPEVLSYSPGSRFADDLLYGNGQVLKAACDSLGITGTSWLVREAVRTAKDVVVAEDEHEAFKAQLPTLLALAGEERFRTLRDEVYAALVTRYAAIPSPPVHTALRDALVGAWKNPWLDRNDSAWRRVSPEARKMVAGWLKLDVLHKFFEVLSEDRGQDRSRFAFWSQYHEQMDDVYIVLGQNAHASNDPDLVKLRQALEGRLLRHNGPADTHAFIMFMGDVVAVEFSQKGNAAHLYPRKDAPVHDVMRSVSMGQLKNKSTGAWMPHVGAWQQRFRQELKLEQHPQPAPSRRPPPGAIGVTRSIDKGAPHASQDRDPGRPAFATNDAAHALPVGFIPFVRSHRLKVEDMRFKGGSLWVIAGDTKPEIGRQLLAWGFVFRQGRGWWWRAQCG